MEEDPVAQTTGESLTQAVRLALQERLRRVRAQQVTPLRSLVETLDDIAVCCAALPDLNTLGRSLRDHRKGECAWSENDDMC